MWEWDSRSIRPKKAGYNRPNALIWECLSGILNNMLDLDLSSENLDGTVTYI